MAIKKSELYSSLWASCDALRGGMDASQYKDYVLVLLFIKYISDKFAGKPYAEITVPVGSGFSDLVALKGKPEIGDLINKNIIAPLAAANKLSPADFPDFADASKLGTNTEMVERLSDLIAIFETKELNFTKNNADGDDILGDAYEYLMRNFATESGKSKGQFYTPSEVSRVIAKIIGINAKNSTTKTSVYDPTCGSGSLLLKVAYEALPTKVTLSGQEKDQATSGLSRMNMALHDYAAARIVQGNTLADPKFKVGSDLKQFDYVVANPPFSDKRWTTGVQVETDSFERFKLFGAPPNKQGDYAYLLHIVASLKSTGTGVCVLPHGVLFRGNAEAVIRKNLIEKGYIAAIIGLPANLFYGTSIPACLIILDKKDAADRKGIFMIDASAGFMKDGPMNRLRDRDIHKIVDIYTRKVDMPRYARMVSVDEIAKNDFNLNLPRYIDSQPLENLQDITGHLHGGIPVANIDALDRYWAVCPELRGRLFKAARPGYVDLAVDAAIVKTSIYEHPEFAAYIADMGAHFIIWRTMAEKSLKALKPGFHPKALIPDLADNLLAHYLDNPLIDPYAVYQHLMDYWTSTMQDDCYLIAASGWKLSTYRIIEKNQKTGKERDKGWACDLVPKHLIVSCFFSKEQEAIDQLAIELAGVAAQLEELESEHGGNEGFFNLDPLNNASVKGRLREIATDSEFLDEATVLSSWITLTGRLSELKKRFKAAEVELDKKALDKYPTLTESQVQALVVEDKWLASISSAVHEELDHISQALTEAIKSLVVAYGQSLKELLVSCELSEQRVIAHLETMHFQWT